MWTETILKVRRKIVIGLVERSISLIKRETWAVEQLPMQACARFVDCDRRPHRVADVADRSLPGRSHRHRRERS